MNAAALALALLLASGDFAWDCWPLDIPCRDAHDNRSAACRRARACFNRGGLRHPPRPARRRHRPPGVA